MNTLYAIIIGFALDLALGDPAWLSHPVIWMGRGITLLEGWLRAALPKTKRGELLGGAVLTVVLPLLAFGICFGLLWMCGLVHPALRLLAEGWLCYRALATRELWRQSMLVYTALKHEGVAAARQAVGRIVGRDIAALDEAGVTRAAVETVAENASDGVIAPLIFMAMGGAPLAMLYKAINTMDSMVGYKNEKYLYFGRAAARLDDAANLLPARLAALCMVATAPLVGLSAKGAWHIWRRDSRNHASPNSAQTEAATAGALGVQLAGDAVYFGKMVHKPTIGDALRPVAAEDIPMANRLMLAASVLALLLCCGARLAVLLI